MDPIAIAFLLTTALGLLLYALLVPKNNSKFISAEDAKSNSGLISAANVIGNEIYSVLPARFAGNGAKKNTRVDSLLQRSGNPWSVKAENWLFYKLVFAFLGFVVGSGFGYVASYAIPQVPWWAVALAGLLFGFFIPEIRYREEAAKRDLEFKRQLPEALDLIIISLSGQETLTTAIADSIENMKPGVLREEFKEIIRTVNTGRPISEALDNFAKRSPNDAITTFVKAVKEAQELNVPLIDVLKSRAEASRQDFFAIINAKTAALPGRMSGVLAMTLVPAVLLTAVAPAFISFMETTAGGF